MEERVFQWTEKWVDMMGLESDSALVKVYRQTRVAHNELLDLNVGAAALLDIQRDCLLS